MTHDELKEELIKNDKEFRLLWEEHQESENRLKQFSEKTLLSTEDETLEKQIKVHKLYLKDRMESMIREHAAPAAS